MSNERREYFRLQLDAQVIVHGEDKSKSLREDTVSAAVKNISAGGLCFTAKNKFAFGSIIKLELRLPDNKNPLYLRGEVTWSSPVKKDGADFYDTGVKILSVEEGNEQRFIRYVCSKMSERLSKFVHL
ncbi:MAG: PilZ domain-containing protein [Candidatus Omnitrophica bacterium]|nr:PilZ domain-containing protein [Candidatus Omnitrophota bacterium]